MKWLLLIPFALIAACERDPKIELGNVTEMPSWSCSGGMSVATTSVCTRLGPMRIPEGCELLDLEWATVTCPKDGAREVRKMQRDGTFKLISTIVYPTNEPIQ